MAVKEEIRSFVTQGPILIRAAWFTRLAIWVAALVLFPSGQLLAQDSGAKARVSEKENVGKRLFYQRCSFCHLGMPTKYQTYAPVLHSDRIVELGDDAVRKKIMDGSVAMPGFKYSLTSDDIDGIVAYLKTVKREDAAHKTSNK